MTKSIVVAQFIERIKGIVLLTLVFFIAGCCCRTDFSKYDVLKEPKINNIPAQKMLVVEVKGDPNEAGKKAFSTLFKTYYKIKKQMKGFEMSAPKARWPKPFNTPKNEWIGLYALPIADTVSELPKQDDASVQVRIETWEYGDVAEILHIGPYGDETPTIEKLYKFIDDSGYKISGPHEEEYLKGPGMFFKGNPKNYKTIIRYTVKKKK